MHNHYIFNTLFQKIPPHFTIEQITLLLYLFPSVCSVVI